MSNVPPAAGQVWASNDDQSKFTLNIGANGLIHGKSESGGIHNWNKTDFHRCFKFIPQNDLEWLAVNEPEWFHDDFSHIRRKQEAAMYTDCPERKLIAHHNWHAKQQWQTMRYDLGLSNTNIVGLEAFAMGCGIAPPITINCPCTTAPLKDTKMIDLSTAVVGDKFTTCTSVVTLVIKGTHHHCLEYPDGSLMLSNDSGLTVDSGSKLMSKHDPRHWLSQLPDAGLFVDKIDHIAANDEGKWWAYIGESNLSSACFGAVDGGAIMINCLKMPKLIGGEWKLSKISIDELRAWQVANKRAQGGPIKPGTAYIVGECGGPDVPVPAGPIVNNSRKEQS